MKKELIEFCRSLNIEYVGIAPPGPYAALADILEERIARGYYTGMEEGNLKKRIDPHVTMPEVRSIIVCLFPYYVGHQRDANLSKYTYARDYHLIIRDKLQAIGEFLKTRIKDFQYMAFADNGPLVDRHLAYLAGLGYYGLNNQIITDQYGSYVFIGYLLTNYPFEMDKPLEKSCMNCGKCIKNCPGKAILGRYNMNPKRCISYITQKKEPLTPEEIEIYCKGEPVLFGCDICQDVCPHNQNARHTVIQDFKENILCALEKEELLKISNKEFKRRYGDRAFGWRGRNVLLRNMDVINNKKK